MGCRCGKQEFKVPEKEDRIRLEHAARAEKIRQTIQKGAIAYVGKEMNGGGVHFEDHCKIFEAVVPPSMEAWQQYLARRCNDIVLNLAHRRGLWDIVVEEKLKVETARLIDEHIQVLKLKDTATQLWGILTRKQPEQKVLPNETYCVQFSERLTGLLEGIHRVVVQHMVSFHIPKLLTQYGPGGGRVVAKNRSRSYSTEQMQVRIPAC